MCKVGGERRNLGASSRSGQGSRRSNKGGRQRTRGKALAFLIEKVHQAGPIENLAVLQAQCSDTDILLNGLKAIYQGNIEVSDIGAVIGSHAGSGTIGVGFVTAK